MTLRSHDDNVFKNKKKKGKFFYSIFSVFFLLAEQNLSADIQKKTTKIKYFFRNKTPLIEHCIIFLLHFQFFLSC